MKWFFKCIRHYADFKGRARRKEYWMFTLVVTVISYAIYLLAFLFTGQAIDMSPYGSADLLGLSPMSSPNPGLLMLFNGISALWNIFIFLPTLAVSVRRLHDIGRSGKLLLVFYGLLIFTVILAVVNLVGNGEDLAANEGSIPITIAGIALIVMSIWLLILMVKPGNVGPNRYGSDPKALDEISQS